MLNELELRNFISFSEAHLDLGPLTVLSGYNSSGKSSILHAIALLRQSAATLPEALLLNGSLVQLGVGADVLHDEPLPSEDDTVSIDISVDGFAVRADYSASADVLTTLDVAEMDRLPAVLDAYYFQYLIADRVPPSVTYPKSHDAVVMRHSLGVRGEHAANYLRVHGDESIRAVGMKHGDASGMSLREQLIAWLNEVSPGATVEASDVDNTDFVRLSYSRSGSRLKSDPHRPTHVGFGLSYSFPVMIALLMAPAESLVMLENPEAHLHPAAQTVLGRMCALAAASGTQVIVETHSDHVLNAIRLAVAEDELTAGAVSMHFLYRDNDELSPVIERIPIGEDGMIGRWPPGFFDEADGMLMRLLG